MGVHCMDSGTVGRWDMPLKEPKQRSRGLGWGWETPGWKGRLGRLRNSGGRSLCFLPQALGSHQQATSRE